MRRRLWGLAKWVAMAATLGVIAGLFVEPATTLLILWGVIIPLVPASLLITPKAWRNVCPLATLNMVTAGRFRRTGQPSGFATGANTLGIVLLVAMVPARHFLFNTDATALALTIIAVAVAALVLGAFYDAKAGFCNAICPVLPVERLYGQSPLMTIDNPRCVPCTHCVRGCVDLSPSKNVPQMLGRTRHGSEWLRTPFGVFAAAFPGFVIGYFTVADGPLSTAGPVYMHVLLWAAGSYALIAMVAAMTAAPIGVVLPAIAALAVGLYYWFAVPGMVAVFGDSQAAEVAMRILALGLVLAWWWRAWSADRTKA